jgi:hypothetical protein
VIEVEDIGLVYPLKQQYLKKTFHLTVVLIFSVSDVLQVAEIEISLLFLLCLAYQYRLDSWMRNTSVDIFTEYILRRINIAYIDSQISDAASTYSAISSKTHKVATALMMDEGKDMKTFNISANVIEYC